MSYTIPTTVQTKAEAVLAVASAIADEDMGARYDGTVNTSLDVLADVLAAQDVQVPQTNAGAILALAQYAHGGGGGGGDFTTATVTMQAAEGFNSSMTLECACIASDDGSTFEGAATSTSAYTEETSKEFTAILYKGKALAFNPVSDGVSLTATGSVESLTGENEGLYLITGDCTFTFANA